MTYTSHGLMTQADLEEYRRDTDWYELNPQADDSDYTSDPDELLTTGQVAALLRIHPQTVTTWAKSGALAGMRVGGWWLYRRADVEAAIGAPLPERGEDLLYAAEVQQLLFIGRSTVHRRALAGELPHFRLPGGALRFRRRDIAALAGGEA